MQLQIKLASTSAYVSVLNVIECLESKSDLELKQNTSPTKTEALPCLQTIRNYLAFISETIDIDYILYIIEKRILVSPFKG